VQSTLVRRYYRLYGRIRKSAGLSGSGSVRRWYTSDSGLPIGRLPGDIFYRGKNTSIYFPLATSLLVSVVLSLVLYLINRFRR
jgi:hypothetical protein